MLRYVRQFFRDLKKYRHYTAYSVKSSLKAELSNTILGYFWWLLDPFLNMLVYTFLVQGIFRRATPAYPVYVFCALLPWKVATTTMSQSTRCIRANAGIIKQVYLPKFILPLVVVFTNSIKLAFGLLILGAMLWVYHIPLSWHILEFIPAFLVFLLFYYSIGLLFTHIGVLFDDMSHLVNYLVMFWYFASPGIWSIDQLPAQFARIIWCNPNTAFFMSFRNTLMYGASPYYKYLGVWAVVSVLLMLIGIPLLYRSDKNYSKVI
ncbi:ABC transporter permease [Sediminispirochaeta bajacaliforniensis]|uniref:ABC transporter permease n=1 Tax=Sediminispirochaeta bajacaliforniensis TaxID=148 RepID=UPI00037A013C|nr:ABC transporter permease [Sediminispirochaeta bajacaliforniensis]